MTAPWTDLLGAADRRLQFQSGDFVFHRASPALEIFVVAEGRVRLERITAAGDAVTVGIVGAGEGLAEAALFSPTYHCDAIAERSSTLFAFAKAPLLDRLSRDPERCLALLRIASSRVQYLRALVELRAIHSASERLVQYLDLRQWMGTHPGDRTLRAVAEEIGLAPETLYRTVRKLVGAGTMKRNGRRLELVDRS